jgi:hypothetical protein
MTRDILASLGPVAHYRESCIVEDDPGAVVRHAQPLDDRARAQLREQAIAQLSRDEPAVQARERRIAIGRGHVTDIRRWRA